MDQLFQIRNIIITYYKKYEAIINYFFKFIIMCFMINMINNTVGYATVLNKSYVMLALALISLVLPVSIIILILILLIGTHLFFASLEVGIILTGMMLIVYLLFIRMFPKLSYLVLIIPISYYFNIPVVVPIIGGMYLGLSSIFPIAIGVVVWHFTSYIKNIVTIESTTLMDMLDTLSKIYQLIIETIAKDKELILTIIVFSAVAIVTRIICQLSIDYSRYIAIGAGIIINLVGFIMGVLILNADINILGIIIKSILALIIIILIQFFDSILNYPKAEKVQFEDDENFYYVKVIPKIIIKKQNRKIKRIIKNENV